MKKAQQFTAMIEREDDGYVSLCLELDIVSQGNTVEDARNNLIEAIELFFEAADPSEIAAHRSFSDLSYPDLYSKSDVIKKNVSNTLRIIENLQIGNGPL